MTLKTVKDSCNQENLLIFNMKLMMMMVMSN